MKKLRKKMRTYTNLLVICTCSLEAMIIRTGTVILDVNSGNELVSEEMINNITATKAIMVYFRKKCSITNQKVILFGCRSIGGWRISIRPDSTVPPPPPVYVHTIICWGEEWNEIIYYRSKHDLSITKKLHS